MTGSSTPQIAPAQQTQMMKDQADFDGPLVDYQAKGTKIEYSGTDTVGMALKLIDEQADAVVNRLVAGYCANRGDTKKK